MGGIRRHNARPPGRNREMQLTSRVFALSRSSHTVINEQQGRCSVTKAKS